ncbi:GNAT family N-acetyltransferase [Streptomyces sp. NPDC005438]|uniref:GNAT family N-acetyltransferase n=1 Tax=Streptomyces sp. NPDC005438 TaxID=3156880 RepID=UPI0033A93526
MAGRRRPDEGASPIALVPWTDGHLPLLRGLNAPAMTRYLGGPESEEVLLARHHRYVRASREGGGPGVMYAVELPTGEVVGSVGYWERDWHGPVYETGWGVLAEYQGRGLARSAMALLLDRAREEGDRRWMHAYPKVENLASQALCRSLGFTERGVCDFEYPPGNPVRCVDWRLDLEG